MTWRLGLVLTAAILLHAVLPRYSVTVAGLNVYRLDRWTGHVDAASIATLRTAPWASVVRMPAAVPAVGDDVTALMNGSAPAPASPQPR